ncbi:MAG: tyrosine-type recombinase/integrase [Caldilineaceae bacterium]|nr:tyrosine-type recombinase/integrase [Caldilineaceae bacterium]
MKQTIEQFLEQLTHNGYSENTIRAYRTDLYQFSAYLARHYPRQPWRSVYEAGLTGYQDWLHSAGRRPPTIDRKCVAVGRFLAFAGLSMAASQSADSPVPVMAENPISPQINSSIRTQIERALSEMAGSAWASRDRALIGLLYHTALGASRLAALNIGDVDAATGEIVWHTAAGQTQRVSPGLSTTAVQAYLRQRSTAAAPSQAALPLFVNRRGSRLTRQGIWLIVRNWSKAAGIQPWLTPRSLRQFALSQPLAASGSRLVLDGISAAI